MRYFAFCLLGMLLVAKAGYARQYGQADSIAKARKMMMDSTARANAARKRFVADSISLFYIRQENPVRSGAYLNEFIKQNRYAGFGFLDLHLKTKGTLKEGVSRNARDPWVLGVVIALLLYTGMLNLFMGKEIRTVFHSFYSKRVLSQVSNEDALLNSWAFVGLFLLFALTTGLFIYQVTASYNIFYRISGFQLFMAMSLFVLCLFIFKFIVLKVVGFIFDVGRIVSDYTAILHLTYFNITFVFLPLTVCFTLLLPHFYPYIRVLALVAVIVVFIWQYLRSSINIVSNFRFHKFYLFIYLCALEICPVLILIKALK